MKKILALIIAFAMVFALAACGAQNNASNENANKPEEVKALTYSEYLAAGDEAAVVIEGYVQVFAYSKAYGNVSMFIQDDDGAYYAFRAVCSEDQAAALAAAPAVPLRAPMHRQQLRL